MEKHTDGRITYDVNVSRSEGYRPYMSDFHSHDFYEINLVLSGDMSIYLPNKDRIGSFRGLILSPPGTPHYITCTDKLLYKRINIFFYENFLAEGVAEYKSVLSAFRHGGSIIELFEESALRFVEIIDKMEAEESTFRKRLLLSYLLSLIAELDGAGEEKHMPEFLSDALAYISKNYREKILASELAHRIGVGRTTLMTSIKKHLGITLSEYITKCRLFNALSLLKGGKGEREAAELCGFGEPSSLIRAFKKEFGTTPMKYLKSEHRENMEKFSL